MTGSANWPLRPDPLLQLAISSASHNQGFNSGARLPEVETGVDVKKQIEQDQPTQTVPALANYLKKSEWGCKDERPEMSRFSLKNACMSFD